MVHSLQQTPQEEAVAKPETLLIVHSWEYRYDMNEIHDYKSNPLFVK